MTGKGLKLIRKSMNLSQSQLAERLGVSHNAISQWERGTRKIPRPVIILIRTIRQLEECRNSLDRIINQLTKIN